MYVISVLCLLCFRTRRFINALWSPAGKGLASWFWFVMSNCEFAPFPLVSWDRCDAWLYRFQIFVLFLTSLVLIVVVFFFGGEGGGVWSLFCYAVSFLTLMYNPPCNDTSGDYIGPVQQNLSVRDRSLFTCQEDGLKFRSIMQILDDPPSKQNLNTMSPLETTRNITWAPPPFTSYCQNAVIMYAISMLYGTFIHLLACMCIWASILNFDKFWQPLKH